MVAITHAASPSSPSLLSDTAAGDLVLRICNSARDGQLVRLRSAKCTVGSGPRCTLRLRARGVAPLHCLIVRGPAAAAVQRWAVDTRLNHRSFVDAPLSPGDRLSIGPIELEVVSLGNDAMPVAEGFREPSASEAQPQPRPSNENSDSHREMQSHLEAQRLQLDELADRLQQREASLNLQAEQLNARLTEIDNGRHAFEEERQQWLGEREEAERRLAEEHKKFALAQAEFRADRDSLAAERREWQSDRDDATGTTAAENQQISARLADIEEQSRVLDDRRRQWAAEQDEAKRQLAQQRDELSARVADLVDQEARLALEREQWEAMRQETADQSSVEAERLNARLTEIDNVRRAFEEERQQWLGERQRSNDAIAQERQQLAARLAEAETQERALAEERRQCEAARQETADQSSVEAERLNARLTEIDNGCRAFEEERQQWLGEQEEAERRLAEEREKFASAQAELRADRDSLAAERRQWQSEREAFESDRAATLADLDSQRAALEAQRRQWETDQAQAAILADEPPADAQSVAEAGLPEEPLLAEPEFQTPTQRSPVDLNEVFRRIGAKVDLEEDEPASDTSPITSQGVDSGLATPSAAPSVPPIAAQVVPNSVPDGTEESIDDYMSRLMQRVRSSGGGSSQSTYAPTGRPEPARVAADPTELSGSVSPSPSIKASMEEPSAPVEMQRRAVAPEKHINLSTLREVANLSAHSALNQHSRRLLIDTMYSKLAIATVALASSVALFWFWTTSSGLEMTFYSALVAVLVALYWGVEYALLTGRLIVSKGHIDIDWSAFAKGKKAEAQGSNVANDVAASHAEEAALPAADSSVKGDSPIFAGHGFGPTCRSVPVPAKIGTVPDSTSPSEDRTLAELAPDGDELADVHGEVAAQQQ